jgi:hypothetical protein
MDLLRMFVAGATARATAEIVGVHRNAATSFYMHLIVPKLTKDYDQTSDRESAGTPWEMENCEGSGRPVAK